MTTMMTMDDSGAVGGDWGRGEHEGRRQRKYVMQSPCRSRCSRQGSDVE